MTCRTILLCAALFAFLCQGISRVEAAGREKPEPGGSEPYPATILVNSWYRDKLIQAAVANIAEETQRIKVAIGTEDIQSELFASQSLSIPARSIAIVYFPVLRQRTAQGALIEADHVSVFRSDGSLIDVQAIQKADPSRAQMIPETFLALSGDALTISYDLEPRSGLRLLFVPRTLTTREKLLFPGRQQQGALPACTVEDLNRLGLPDEYLKQVRARLTDNYGYIVKTGQGARIRVEYRVAEIRDCILARIADYQYFFSPDSSVHSGGSPGVAVMIYNPSVMKISTPFPLTPEGNKQRNTKQ